MCRPGRSPVEAEGVNAYRFRDAPAYLAWGQSILATLGSLYFSEIAGFPPCILCWYQRICMYPLVAVLTVGILRRDRGTPYFALPLALAGLGISAYHNLLYWKIIPEADAPCRLGVSCTTRFIEWLGFVTIPFLSFVAFTVIACCMLSLIRPKNKVND